MTKKEKENLAFILFESHPEMATMNVLNNYPDIKKAYNKLKEQSNKKESSYEAETQKMKENYMNIGKKYSGRLFFGDSMRFDVDGDGKEKADKDWQKLYGTKYPTSI